MYNELSVLNQDVAYELPATTTWAVLLHLGIGALALSLAAAPRRAGGSPEGCDRSRRSRMK